MAQKTDKTDDEMPDPSLADLYRAELVLRADARALRTGIDEGLVRKEVVDSCERVADWLKAVRAGIRCICPVGFGQARGTHLVAMDCPVHGARGAKGQVTP
jgi:hypothetical protein